MNVPNFLYDNGDLEENGQWKCIPAQITKASPGNYAGDETIVRKYDCKEIRLQERIR